MVLRHSVVIVADERESLLEVPGPLGKLLFEAEHEALLEVEAYIRGRGWADGYELIYSGKTLLELTAKGANKGGMVVRMAQMLGISRENVVCVGDHANDISMLTWAGLGCAPANAIPQVRETPGVHVLPDCREDAIAALIDELEKALV